MKPCVKDRSFQLTNEVASYVFEVTSQSEHVELDTYNHLYNTPWPGVPSKGIQFMVCCISHDKSRAPTGKMAFETYHPAETAGR